ncbi:hypothetical protein [Diplocloster hominis]|uniref:hypothetical protein n=1 Tax=Diplocloster hominis TaxID=3079010 RepID=UPI0031BB2947
MRFGLEGSGGGGDVPTDGCLPETLAALANGNSCSCAAGIIGRVPGLWACAGSC